MPLVSAAEIWLAMAVASGVGLGTGILAGRSTRAVSRTVFLFFEFVPFGAVLVLWMFEVWFVAKTLMVVGFGASVALVIAIVCGIALVLVAGCVGALLLWVAYEVRGSREQFRPDLRNSLWLSKGYSWRATSRPPGRSRCIRPS